MVDFRSELRPASFRGLSFHVADDDAGFGRRIVTHEYPGRDEPGHEDLGQTPRSFSMQIVVIGAGYVANAKALEAAFLQPGPGTLIHPHYGEMQVVVKDVRRTHSGSAIGEVGFSAAFERTTSVQSVTALNDTARNLGFASSNLFDIASLDFSSSLASGLFPAFVAETGIGQLQSFLSYAQSLFRHNGLSNLLGAFSFTGLNSGTGDDVAKLFKGVASTVKPQVVPVVGSLSSTATLTEPVNLIRALVGVANHSVDSPIVASGPSRAAIVTNASAISTLFKTSALAAAGLSLIHI